ncbi:AAA family ATPase [Marinifilum fragile]|uniref:AAA family ATPase n=1 Tax=Marinifilum fragile TaxID=570161 RepID=UPI002AA84D8B|nr:AAA family ATPase [Marinifilum fragile]
MELLYVWIEDYKNIKKQGFNFSPKHRFDFEYEEEDGKVIGGTLHHKERNTNYPKKFFGENISNVTAIVGKNGSGKTNLLDTIVQNIGITIGAKGSKKYNFIAVFKKKHISKNNVKNEEDQFFIRTSSQFGTIELPMDIKIEPLYFELDSNSIGFMNTTFIYYSNFLDFNIINTAYQGNEYMNISSNFILQIDQYFDSYKRKNLYELIKFWNDHRNISSKIKTPKAIVFNLKEFDLDFEVNEGEHIDTLADLSVSIRNWKNSVKSVSTDIFISLLKLIIHTEIEFSNQKKIPFAKIQQLIDSNPTIEVARSKFEEYISNSYLKSLLEEAYQFARFLENRVNRNKDYFILRISFDNLRDMDDLKKLFRYLDKFSNNNLFWYHFSSLIEFSYLFKNNEQGNLSAGEFAFFTLLMRLNNTLKSSSTKKDILLLIDEGEIGFHPEWQKGYIKLFLETIPKINNQRSYQIIFTSHSPFLVSDLPKDNIIFLNKKDDGMCKVCEKDELPDYTFGANIHSLYRNSFFLENGLMGEFAKGKIDQVIRNLNNELQNEEDKMSPGDMLFVIQQIGEPLLKNKLQEMFDHYEFELNDEIEILEAKLAELKSNKQ